MKEAPPPERGPRAATAAASPSAAPASPHHPAARPALRAVPGPAARGEDCRRPLPPGPAAPRASSAPLPRGAPPTPAPKMSNLSKGTGSRKDTKMRIRAFPVSTGPAGPVGRPRRGRPPQASRPRALSAVGAGGTPGRAGPAAGPLGAGGRRRAGSRRVPGAALRVRRRWAVRNGAPRAPAACPEAPRCGESARGGGRPAAGSSLFSRQRPRQGVEGYAASSTTPVSSGRGVVFVCVFRRVSSSRIYLSLYAVKETVSRTIMRLRWRSASRCCKRRAQVTSVRVL